MLRMNTPASPAWACMRTRSPRSAPPVNGLVGSIAITPTVRPEALSSDVIRSTSVLFPAPGGPVTPTRYARPVRAKICWISDAPSAPSSSTREIALATARTSPASTRSDRVAVTGSRSLAEELARNDEPLDLARALADGQELDVAEKL